MLALTFENIHTVYGVAALFFIDRIKMNEYKARQTHDSRDRPCNKPNGKYRAGGLEYIGAIPRSAENEA